MSKLNTFWITDKHVDFEYKKYQLLSYFQSVEKYFLLNKLFPPFTELINHYKRLTSLKNMKAALNHQFPKELIEVDLKNFQLNYQEMFNDCEMIKEIDKIINFSLPKFEEYIREGEKLYEFFEQHIEISPVGVIPLYLKEGYLFLQDDSKNSTKVYEYKITLYEGSEVEYKGIRTNFISWYSNTIINTSGNIKSKLIKHRVKLPNPAIYLAKTSIAIPETETFLPIAKQALVKYISTDSDLKQGTI